MHPSIENSPFELYKVKMFIRFKNNEHQHEQEISKLKGMLEFLTLDIKNIKGGSTVDGYHYNVKAILIS